MTVTDILSGIFLLYFFIVGWNKGLIRSLMGPLATFTSIVAVYGFFNKTHNPFLCFLILILGPFLLSVLFSLIFGLWQKYVTFNESPALMNRSLGGLFYALWGGSMIVLVVVFIAIMPQRVFKFKKLQQDVLSSYSFRFLRNAFLKESALLNGMEDILKVYEDPEKIHEISSTPGFEEIYNDKKIQAILADEEIVKLIKDKDVFRLLMQPKVMEIWQDDTLIKKFLSLTDTKL